MQSDDLFLRKFCRQRPRPPLATVNFDSKRDGDPFLLLGLHATPPEPDGFFRALSAPTGETSKPAKPPKPEVLSKKAKPSPPQIPQPGPYDNLGGGAWVRNFAHYDVQSILFDLLEATPSSPSQGGGSGGGAVEDPDQGLLDEGDGNDNELLLSCPHFRNEMGGEERAGLGLTQGRVCLWLSLRNPNDAVSVLEEPRESHVQQQGKSNYFIEHADLGAHYYRKYFYMKGEYHQNFFGMDDRLGPVAISFRREEKEGSSGAQYNYRIIFRTTELKTLRGSILEESVPSAARHTTPRGLSPKRLLEFIIPELNLHCLRLASTSPKVRDTLLKLDEQGLNFQRKVGVMYCRAGQSSEEDMYNNESSGPAFEEFLDLLGERVKLKGWEKYRAQLDTKTDSTGIQSLYTRYQDYEVMFHVSTMLPYTANNTQQVTNNTQYIHTTHFSLSPRVAVTRSKDIPLFGPLFPKGARFPRSPAFRDFLLAKAVNAENAAEKAEKFRSMATRTRQEYLKDLAENYRGEAVSISVIDSQAEEIREMVQRLELVTRGCEAREVTPLRDGVGQPGFLMSEEGFVTDLQRFGYAESGGLQLGARVVRLCGHALVHLGLEERAKLLRNAHKIHITVIPPDENGKPRRSERGVRGSERWMGIEDSGEGRVTWQGLGERQIWREGWGSGFATEAAKHRDTTPWWWLFVIVKPENLPAHKSHNSIVLSYCIVLYTLMVCCSPSEICFCYESTLKDLFSLSVLSETTDSSEEEWQSIADLAAACRSILEALSQEATPHPPPPIPSPLSPLHPSQPWWSDRRVLLCAAPWQEKEDKAVLQAEVQSLRQNNQRLQEESQSTVSRLIKVTELLCNVNKPC
uniref:Signal-induced proliferation-associated 1 n=1 Tax=Hucho hucho TaxID=62062 RepID=A0A4W5Q853_9TELE